MKKLLLNKLREFYSLLCDSETEIVRKIAINEKKDNYKAVIVGLAVSGLGMSVNTNAALTLLFIAYYIRYRAFARFIYPHRRVIFSTIVAAIVMAIVIKLNIEVINHGRNNSDWTNKS